MRDEFVGLLLDLPFVACGIVVCALGWRALPLRRSVAEARTVSARRLACLTHFLWLFADVPAFLCAALCVLTVWRAPLLLRELGWMQSPW